jgi:putative ABC transport system permease protein
MIYSYIKTALRNIHRHRGFSFINVFGLALSMSVCLLIILVINDQLSYDDFHENRKRIYRVLTNNERSSELVTRFASTALPLGYVLEENNDLVESVAIFNTRLGGDWKANEKVIPVEGFYANTDFFKVFDFEVTGRAREDLLREPRTVVLREKTARKFFGDANPIGKIIEVDTLGGFTITGIIPESKNKSHLRFEALVSMESIPYDWYDNWTQVWASYAYVMVHEGVRPEQFEPTFARLSKDHYSNDPDHDYTFSLQALSDICPGPVLGNEPGFFLPNIFVYAMAGLAFLVIISAAFNYTNLSLAKSLTRTGEIGVRKVAGASRGQIFVQFLIESVIIALISLVLAYLVLQFLSPAFSRMRFMSMLEINPSENARIYIYFLLFAIFTGLVAGFLPALYVSSFNPVNIFKAAGRLKIFSRTTFRKGLVVAQFTISMVLIVTIILLVRQLNYYMNQDYGFQKENILSLARQGVKKDVLESELAKVPEIKNIAWGSHIPAMGNRWNLEFWKDHRDNRINMAYFSVDHKYIDLMQLQILAGQNFNENRSDGLSNGIIINEKAVEEFQLRSPDEAIGTMLYGDDSLVLEVVGVIRDYHYVALFERIGPMGLINNNHTHRMAHLALASDDIIGALGKIERIWKKLDPHHDIDMEFLDEEIRDYYRFFNDILYMVGFAALLAIVVACLGLLGMAIYIIESRLKDFGIRKVMGADGRSLFYTAGRSFFMLILLATMIAIPLAYFGNQLWLQSLPYRVSFGILDIGLGTVITFILSFLVLAPQTIKASLVEPARLLRYE